MYEFQHQETSEKSLKVCVPFLESSKRKREKQKRKRNSFFFLFISQIFLFPIHLPNSSHSLHSFYRFESIFKSFFLFWSRKLLFLPLDLFFPSFFAFAFEFKSKTRLHFLVIQKKYSVIVDCGLFFHSSSLISPSLGGCSFTFQIVSPFLLNFHFFAFESFHESSFLNVQLDWTSSSLKRKQTTKRRKLKFFLFFFSSPK